MDHHPYKKKTVQTSKEMMRLLGTKDFDSLQRKKILNLEQKKHDKRDKSNDSTLKMLKGHKHN